MFPETPFTLFYDAEPSQEYPHGCWRAHSRNYDADGSGPDPLTAVTLLLLDIEAMKEIE